MAEEVVVKEQLTAALLEAGEELTKRLRRAADFRLLCSLWLYDSELNRWKINIGTPLVETQGPLHVYRKIHELMGEDWPSWESPLYLASALRSDHPIVVAIRSLGHFEIQGLPEDQKASPLLKRLKKIRDNQILGVFIEEAIVYYIE